MWLVVFVQQLDYPIGSHTNNIGDAPIVFSLPMRPVVYLAYSFFGAGVFAAVLVIILLGSMNGDKTFFWRRSEERKRVAKDAKMLLDYDPTHNPDLFSGELVHTAAAALLAFPMAHHGVGPSDGEVRFRTSEPNREPRTEPPPNRTARTVGHGSVHGS